MIEQPFVSAQITLSEKIGNFIEQAVFRAIKKFVVGFLYGLGGSFSALIVYLLYLKIGG